MLSDARNLWKAMQMLNENITTALEGFDDGTDDYEKENDALKRDELDIYKKMLDDAQMQQFELSKQSRLLLAEKDAELSLWKQKVNGVLGSDLLEGLDMLKLYAEKQALEENLENAEQELRKSLSEKNEAIVKMQKFDEISAHYNTLKAEYESAIEAWKAKELQKNDTIDNLVAEYSKLAAEADFRQNKAKEVEQNNEVLTMKMKALEHSIGELADRASGNESVNESAAATELKKIRLKVVNLQFDLKEKESEIISLKQTIEQLQLSSKQLSVGNDPAIISSNKNLLKEQEEHEGLRRDIARLQSEKLELEEAGKEYFQQNKLLQKELDILKSSGGEETKVLREMLDNARTRLRDSESRLVADSEAHSITISTLQDRLGSSEKSAADARAEVEHSKHEVARLTKSLQDAISSAALSQAADVNAIREEMRERDRKAIIDMETAVKEARREAAVQAERSTATAVMAAVSKERAQATASLETMRSELNSQHATKEIDLLQRATEERERAVIAVREAAEKSKTDALNKLRSELESQMREAIAKLEADLRAEAASELSCHTLAASAKLREAVDTERRQARNELEAAIRLAEAKHKDLETRTRELETNFTEKVEREVAQVEARISAESQRAMQQLQRETRAVVLRAEQERDEYQAMFVKENKQRKLLHNKILDLQGNIRVFCRVRPMVEVERRSAEAVDVTEFPSEEDIVLQKDSASKAKYEFDRVFPPGSSQELVFENVKPTCLSVLDGYNVCIFAYGQTGSGKTFTMEGYGDQHGVSPRAVREIFDLIGSMVNEWSYTVLFSMLEIYNENIRDLLDSSDNSTKERLDIRQTAEGNIVPGLTEVQVFSPDQVLGLMADGQRNRAVGSHNMNALSSRSHSILTLHVRGRSLKDGGAQASYGKLHLIDLAGSERVGKTDATGDRLKEAQNINKSLSALGDVIAAIGSKGKAGGHVPYRNSKLTFLLQDSLGGNSKVLMFVNISPVLYNVGESICSLNFAARCRNTELGQARKNSSTRPTVQGSTAIAPSPSTAGFTGVDASSRRISTASSASKK